MKKVLMVEDDTSLQELYKKKLGEAGFEVFQALDATHGLQIAKTNHPDLIFLDIMLPGGMNGFDLLEQIKRDKELQNIPVIILTNLDSEEQTAKSMGANDYIIKTNTSIEEVIQKAQNLLK